MKEENYTIYKVENKYNGLVYIGATKRDLETRKSEHIQKAYNNSEKPLHQATYTHGIDAFTWETIDTARNSNELAKKEKHYILEYSSKENGYNLDSGGGFKKTVYQYCIKDGSLIESYDCLQSAANVINATKQQISRACLSVSNIYGEYYWNYQLQEPFIPNKDKRLKEVCQYDLDNYYIKSYSSVSIASQETGINKGSIAKVCRRERSTAGGFKWKYK
jgi:group I intron endonuclease